RGVNHLLPRHGQQRRKTWHLHAAVHEAWDLHFLLPFPRTSRHRAPASGARTEGRHPGFDREFRHANVGRNHCVAGIGPRLIGEDAMCRTILSKTVIIIGLPALINRAPTGKARSTLGLRTGADSRLVNTPRPVGSNRAILVRSRLIVRPTEAFSWIRRP